MNKDPNYYNKWWELVEDSKNILLLLKHFHQN